MYRNLGRWRTFSRGWRCSMRRCWRRYRWRWGLEFHCWSWHTYFSNTKRWRHEPGEKIAGDSVDYLHHRRRGDAGDGLRAAADAGNAAANDAIGRDGYFRAGIDPGRFARAAGDVFVDQHREPEDREEPGEHRHQDRAGADAPAAVHVGAYFSDLEQGVQPERAGGVSGQ